MSDVRLRTPTPLQGVPRGALPSVRVVILAAAILFLSAVLSPDADKGATADRLRDAMRQAGCTDVVIEMAPTPAGAPMHLIARCRDPQPEDSK